LKFTKPILVSIITALESASLIYADGITIPANGKIYVNSGTLNVPGDILNLGLLQVSTGTITVAGNWINDGTFISGVGTVEFSGTTGQTISGETAFYNFFCTKAGETLTFDADKTQTITSLLKLQGDIGNYIRLRSTIDGTRWKINLQGTWSVNYVDIKDSDNINSNWIEPNVWIDSGNNSGWGSEPAPTPTPTPAVTPTPEICCNVAFIKLFPRKLKLKKGKSKSVTATLTGKKACLVEGERIKARITKGRRRIRISPKCTITDSNGQAEFIITARKGIRHARVRFRSWDVRKVLRVKLVHGQEDP